MQTNNKWRGGVLALGFASALAWPAMAADDDLVWQFNEFRDQDTRRMNATLTYGIPETDAVKVQGVCEAKAGTAVQTSSVVFAADVGRLKNGTDVSLRFSGGGVSTTLKGSVAGVDNTEERITGVRVEIKHDDAFWKTLQTSTGFDFLIPGYRSNTLNLSGARSKIKEFVQTCQDYADALGSDQNTASGNGASSDKISEKEAFAIAKELGTIEAWEAFLNNFPSGFRSDLARAYVKRLGQGSGTGGTQQTSQPSQPNQPTQPETQSETDSEPVRSVYIEEGTSRWWNSRRHVAYDGGRRQYTASVRTGGLELVTYCHRYGRNRDLTAIIREVNPRAGSRIGRALKQAATSAPRMKIPGAWDAAGRIDISFSDGSVVRQAATNRNFLEKEFRLLSRGRAIKATDRMVGLMMSENSMSIAAPPLDVTFQLSGSRAAICSVLNKCGARRPDCRGFSSSSSEEENTPTSSSCGKNSYRNSSGACRCRKGFTRSKGKCVRKRKVSCSGNRVFSSSRNKCVCPKSEPHWYGGRCRAVRDCPGDSDLINGICQKVDEDNGQDAPQNCGKGRTWVGAQGKCVCIDRSKKWNGNRCVKQSSGQTNQQNNAKQTACAILQTACALGSKKACQQAQNGGC